MLPILFREQIVFGKSGNNRVSKRLDLLAAALLPVDEDRGKSDIASFASHGFNGCDGRVAFGDDVIDHNDFVAGFEVPFDELGLAVAFRGFTDDERLQRDGRGFTIGMHAGRERDGIGAHGKTADAGDGDAEFARPLGDQAIHDLADEGGGFGIERGEAAVDVISAFRPGG